MTGQAGHSATPRLSVVIACFNGAATLAQQLSALAGQSCPQPWELILADNGSTDGSRLVALSFADRLPLRVLDASCRQGPAHARNVGVRAARGEWVAFCDADDVVADDWLAAVCTAMARHAFVAGRVDLHLLNRASVARSRTMDQQEDLQPACGNRLGLPHAGAGNMAIHREVFERVGGFDEGLLCLEDTDLCWRVQQAGTPLVFEPGMVLHTRLRSSWRGNFRQGLNYARGQSGLERRYGRLAPSVGRGRAAHGGLGRLGSTARALLQVRNVRGFMWRCGWFVGRARTIDVRQGAQQLESGSATSGQLT